MDTCQFLMTEQSIFIGCQCINNKQYINKEATYVLVVLLWPFFLVLKKRWDQAITHTFVWGMFGIFLFSDGKC